MSTRQPDPPEAERDRRPSEPSLADLADTIIRKIVTALVLAASLIALAIYSRPGPPRYQAIAEEGKIVRVDTRSGTIISCEGERCAIVLRRGQRLDRRPAPQPLPKPAAPAPQTLPAPSPAPAPATK